jgi:hypothetical protein
MAQQQEQEILEKLKNAMDDFYKKALAYYLQFETSEMRLEQDKKNEIKDKYGFERFMPAFHWTHIFGNELGESDQLDAIILDYFKSINYDKEGFVLPRDRVKNMLWNKARRQGKEILKSYSS